MVLALVMLGGKQDSTNIERARSSPSESVTPAVSRIIREPSLLYISGEQRVSFLVALEYGNDNEIQHAAALVPPDATEAPPTIEASTAVVDEPTATASPSSWDRPPYGSDNTMLTPG